MISDVQMLIIKEEFPHWKNKYGLVCSMNAFTMFNAINRETLDPGTPQQIFQLTRIKTS